MTHVHLRGLATELGLQLDDLWQGDVPDAISPSWINGGYAAYPPGQVTKVLGYAGVPEGRVPFAGEHRW